MRQRFEAMIPGQMCPPSDATRSELREPRDGQLSTGKCTDAIRGRKLTLRLRAFAPSRETSEKPNRENARNKMACSPLLHLSEELLFLAQILSNSGHFSRMIHRTQSI